MRTNSSLPFLSLNRLAETDNVVGHAALQQVNAKKTQYNKSSIFVKHSQSPE